MNNDRVMRLQQEMANEGIDGVAVVPGPNMDYLSQVHSHLSERPIMLVYPARDEPAIVIPRLEAMKAEADGIPPARIFAWSDEEGYTNAFTRLCRQLGLAGYLLAVEAFNMRVLELELLQQYAPGIRLTHAEPLIMRLRAVKDASEIETMERAIDISQRAMEKLIPEIEIGMTEKQIAARLRQHQLDLGADGVSFGPIVSSGPNGASPHALPSDRPIAAGDLMVIDWGCLVDGYPSDITRTFAVGPISDESRHVYDIVKLANQQGVRAAAPGATGADIDTAARDVIDDAGFGDYFIHRTGHGLGVEVHEPPYMMQGNDEGLVTGNVFTVEPGIYIGGKVGVRIEDDILVTESGCRSLTTFSRELITVGGQ